MPAGHDVIASSVSVYFNSWITHVGRVVYLCEALYKVFMARRQLKCSNCAVQGEARR